jgi:hypothetical protein
VAREAGVRILGVDALVRSLKTAADTIDELKDAHKRAGDIVADEAELRAPRRTGALAGSIKAARQAKRARVQAGRAAVPYAGPIHWGWPARNIEAQPFLTDAATATESQWFAAYLEDVQAALDKVKGV